MESSTTTTVSPDGQTITISGHVTPEEKAAGDYKYLAFVVPPETDRLEVSYDYGRTRFAQSKRGEENTIDIGIFAPDSGAKDPGEFRGWSGGARTGFFISREAATPGYLPGPVPSGTWHLILGLYRIGSDGCDFTVSITFVPGRVDREDVSEAHGTGEPAAETDPPVSRASGSNGLTWFVGDLQSHTHHSDANASVEELARVAAHRGLDFLAVTDHNTISHHPELKTNSTADLLLLPGMEITTYYGHANTWGLHEWVDFRIRSAADIPPRIEAAHQQKALVSINHPISDCPWTYGWIPGIDAIEVWQGLWNGGNLTAVQWWDELLSAGHRIVGVGGSDRHQPAHYDMYFPHQVGTPSTRVKAARLSTDSILEGLKAGRVGVGETPAGPWVDLGLKRADGTTAFAGDTVGVDRDADLELHCTIDGAVGDTVEIVTDGEMVARRTISNKVEAFTFRPGPEPRTYVRAQIIAGPAGSSRDGVLYPRLRALSNPIYFRRVPGGGGTVG